MSYTPTHARKSRRSILRWWWAVPVALVLVWVAALGWDAIHLRGDAAALRDHAAAARQAVDDRDIQALATESAALGKASDSFAGHSSGPQWWIAAHIPWVGDQVAPLRAAGNAVEGLTADALDPLSKLKGLEALDTPKFVDGRIDPLILEPYRPTLETASEAVHRERLALAAVNLDHTVGAVKRPFASLVSDLDSVGAILDNANSLAQLLPPMLGAEGPRQYVVIVQNNAEPRATGGIPGAIIMITVDDGRLALGDYFSAGDLNNKGLTPPTPLRADEANLFSENMGMYAQNATDTPEFPRTGELIAAFVERKTGVRPDGVVSLDPVALGYMLKGAPARDIDGIKVSGNDLAEVMLSTAYSVFPNPRDQDAFFAKAAGELFGDIVTGGGSAVAGVQQALKEARFSVWSDHTAEQSILDGTRAGGDFLIRDNAAGVFLNDGSGSKIGYYIDTAVTAQVNQCAASGAITGGTLTVTVTHTYDGKVVDLPWYVSGGGVYVPPGRFEANVLVYPPQGMGVSSLMADGKQALMNSVMQGSRLATSARIGLDPGQKTTLTYALVPTGGPVAWTDIVVTPGPKHKLYTNPVVKADNPC